VALLQCSLPVFVEYKLATTTMQQLCSRGSIQQLRNDECSADGDGVVNWYQAKWLPNCVNVVVIRSVLINARM
jgi:hypothetical protein